MSKDYAYIEISIEDGNESQPEFKWIGKSKTTVINYWSLRRWGWIQEEKTLKIGDIIYIGQYKVKVLDFTNDLFGVIILRVDNYFYWLFYFRYKLMQLIELICYRILFTLEVWGLAERNPAMYPSWTDIKIVKKFRRK